MFKTEVSSEDIQKARQTAKRSRTSVACSRCKTGKMKCSDYRPCKQCTNSRLACDEVREKISSGADTVEKSLAWRRSERAVKIYHVEEFHQPLQPADAANLPAGHRQRQDINEIETLGSPSHSDPSFENSRCFPHDKCHVLFIYTSRSISEQHEHTARFAVL